MLFAKTTDKISLNGNLGEQTWQLLEAAGLAWQVKKEPLFTGLGIPTEGFGMIRSDNEKCLGIVKARYTPFQNSEMAETVIQASAGLGTEYRGGHIKEGQKVFIQLALDDEKVANDTVKRFITCLNSHDGSTAIGFGSSNTVVICQNTFYRAYREIEKIHHTESSKVRIELAAEELRRSISNDQKLMDNYKRMTEQKIDKPLFADIISILFNEEIDVKGKEISSRKQNQIASFNSTLKKELTSHGETLWGLFNAVTFFENHIRVKTENKDALVMTGGGYKKMNASYDSIMKWIDDHSPKQYAVK